MPFGIILDSRTTFLLMLGNLALGVRSYQLIRSSQSRKMLEINWRISIITHLVASVLFLFVGTYFGR